mgnify:CR=1 FL=1
MVAAHTGITGVARLLGVVGLGIGIVVGAAGVFCGVLLVAVGELLKLLAKIAAK